MKVRVTRQDGILAVTIPEEIAAAARLEENCEVEIEVRGNAIVVSRVAGNDTTEFRPPIGNEIW